jgi:hypothetical protein
LFLQQPCQYAAVTKIYKTQQLFSGTHAELRDLSSDTVRSQTTPARRGKYFTWGVLLCSQSQY